MAKKTALVLSGGGSKGAFQFMAEKYAREVKGYQWDIIAGVSVGALNGMLLAMKGANTLIVIRARITHCETTASFRLRNSRVTSAH